METMNTLRIADARFLDAALDSDLPAHVFLAIAVAAALALILIAWRSESAAPREFEQALAAPARSAPGVAPPFDTGVPDAARVFGRARMEAEPVLPMPPTF